MTDTKKETKNIRDHFFRFLEKNIPKRLDGIESVKLSVLNEIPQEYYSIILSLNEFVKNDECQQFKMLSEVQKLFNYYGMENGFEIRVVSN
jgi:hypothetical protein